jgi:hypothetical protein
MSDQPGIDHRDMLGLAPVVIAEASHLALAMNDDALARRLSRE